MNAQLVDHRYQRVCQRAASVVAAVALVTAAAAVLRAQSSPHEHGQDVAMSAAPLRTGIRGPAPGVSRAPSAAFDTSGRLWLVWAENRYVFVSSSRDLGRSFEPAVPVNPAPEDIDANSESRPKIAIGLRGQIYVTYTRTGAKPYTGDVRFSRSIDTGRSFFTPVTLNDDGVETGHRFDTLVVGADGRIVVAWIDKRDVEQASHEGRNYDGAALYYGVSRDEGRTFDRNRKLKDGICECCRLAPAVEPGGRVALFWRDILPGGIRDHVLGWIGQDSAAGPVTRVARDGWAIDGCPHHGPSLAISTDGMYHAVWFTGAGPAGPGAFYARSTDRGHSFSEPRRVGQPNAQSHAVVFADDRRVWLAWKQSTSPQATGVFVQRSDDDGATWGPAQEIASTRGASDHPFVIAAGTGVFLSWFTAADGYRLVRVSGLAPR